MADNYPDGKCSVKTSNAGNKYFSVAVLADAFTDAKKYKGKDSKVRFYLTINKNKSYDPDKEGSSEYNVYVNDPNSKSGSSKPAQTSNDRSDEVPF